MVKKKHIRQAYENCLNKSCNFLNHQGLSTSKSTTVVLRNHDTKPEHVVVRLSEPLYFEAWPLRKGSRKKVDILAEIVETIELNDGMCVHSTLRMNYFRVDGEKRMCVEALHYDFSQSVESQHPVCHAQNMNTILDPLPDRFPEDIDVGPIEHRNQSVRIPSAFVNFAGLFVKLTADHLRADVYDEYWATCDSYIRAIPDHASNKVFGQIFDSTSLHSYSWYER